MPLLTDIHHFLLKQISACMFGIFILLLIVTSKFFYTETVAHITQLYRYDFMLLCAILFQIFLLISKRETWREFLVIIIFHAMALVMEIFKVYAGSWVYPEKALFAIAGVPLFAGFMYSAVGSYLARTHQLFDIHYEAYPKTILTIILVLGVYINFFSHHYWYDLRWVLTVFSILLFWRTKMTLVFDNHPNTKNIQNNSDSNPNNKNRHIKKSWRLPILLPFIIIALLIWLAENIATFSNVWLYPNQINAWQMVSFSKVSSWYLLMLLSFVMVVIIQEKPNAS